MSKALPLLLALFSAAGAPAQPRATKLHARLQARVAKYTLSATNLADALVKTSGRFRVPMGIEWVRDKQTARGVNRTWNSRTVLQILRSIVDEYPGYELRLDNGVVHVFRGGLPEDRSNFLNLKVPDSFTVRHEAVGPANERLLSVVRSIVSPPKPAGARGEGFEYATGIAEKPLTLPLRGATVREALEKFAASSEREIWIVTFSSPRELTPAGFRRAETLWRRGPVPDAQQPIWDLLAWGAPS